MNNIQNLLPDLDKSTTIIEYLNQLEDSINDSGFADDDGYESFIKCRFCDNPLRANNDFVYLLEIFVSDVTYLDFLNEHANLNIKMNGDLLSDFVCVECLIYYIII